MPDVPAVLSPEELARVFHAAYERLAPSFGYRTRVESAVLWDDVPETNRALMVAAAAEVVATLRLLTEPEALDAVARVTNRAKVAEAERDAAVARAEHAEVERDKVRGWYDRAVKVIKTSKHRDLAHFEAVLRSALRYVEAGDGHAPVVLRDALSRIRRSDMMISRGLDYVTARCNGAVKRAEAAESLLDQARAVLERVTSASGNYSDLVAAAADARLLLDLLTPTTEPEGRVAETG